VAVAVPAESSVLLEIGEKEEEEENEEEEEELAPATVSVSDKQVPASVTICEGC
jgi:hypothetical protein